MLKKYINKKVEITEKHYGGFCTRLMMGNDKLATTIGTITDVDDKFIEIDNEILININHIFRIKIIK